MNARRFRDCAREETVSTPWGLSSAGALLATSRVRQLRNAKVRLPRVQARWLILNLGKTMRLELLKLTSIILILYLNMEVCV